MKYNNVNVHDKIYAIGIKNSKSLSRLNQLPTIKHDLQCFHNFLHVNKSLVI